MGIENNNCIGGFQHESFLMMDTPQHSSTCTRTVRSNYLHAGTPGPFFFFQFLAFSTSSFFSYFFPSITISFENILFSFSYLYLYYNICYSSMGPLFGLRLGQNVSLTFNNNNNNNNAWYLRIKCKELRYW